MMSATDNTEPLLYNGKPMSAAPINAAFSPIVSLLKIYRPQIIILEPGDMTRYRLLVVRVPGDPHGLAVTFLGAWSYDDIDGHKTTVLDLRHGKVTEYDVQPLTKNGWSQQFLAWWLTILVGAIREES